MGFMDKAKKMAEQAQQKLDDVQKNFNENQGSGGTQQGGPAVEYDKHGRPVNAPVSADAPPAPAPTEAAPPASPAPGSPSPDPAVADASQTPEPAKVEGDPLLADEPGSRQGADAERGEPTPPRAPGNLPGMTSGDPLG